MADVACAHVLPQDLDARVRMALGANTQVGEDWVCAADLKPLCDDDPCLIWLRFHGAEHGFRPDVDDSRTSRFQGRKKREFADACVRMLQQRAGQFAAPPQGYMKSGEALERQAAQRTCDLMRANAPLIRNAALWWAPECLYATADLLIHVDVLPRFFPDMKFALAPAGPYVIVGLYNVNAPAGIKEPRKLSLRLASYILGRQQGAMPAGVYALLRDGTEQPHYLPIDHAPDGGLAEDVQAMRDTFLDIKHDGGDRRPWRDECVRVNHKNKNEQPWAGAKRSIAREEQPRDMTIAHRITPNVRTALRGIGYASLEDLLAVDPAAIPFEGLRAGIGPAFAPRVRAFLTANRTGKPTPFDMAHLPAKKRLPASRPMEFYIDVETLGNLNYDCERDWPNLRGCPMVFMIGVGWEEAGIFQFTSFTAPTEDHAGETIMFRHFLDFMRGKGMDFGRDTGNDLAASHAVFFHWNHTERTEFANSHARNGFPEVRNLPFFNLEALCIDTNLAMPGAWSYSLKDFATALGAYSSYYGVKWPLGLGEGLEASALGWELYAEGPMPLPHTGNAERDLLEQYLRTDCEATWQITRWLRAPQGDNAN